MNLSASLGDETVIASHFGWNETDATEALQQAIDSGAKKVVVDKRSGPWIVRPIVLRSDLELVLEEGVEILAKKGEYLRGGEVMIRAQNVSNVVIRGEGKGATLRMRKTDYWSAPYPLAEWRHAVSLLSAENVTIENVTIAESGGDGIYLGVGSTEPSPKPCKNITIRNVDCVANNRQGISVISVDGLTIEDCVLRDTIGTAPEAGIDFEPNNEYDQITNVAMRRVKCVNNKGDGISFYLINLKDTGKPLSFTIEDCEVTRNFRAGLSFQVANKEGAVLSGKGVIKNSVFMGNPIGMAFRSKWANGTPLEFENVKLITPSVAKVLSFGEYRDYDFNVVTDEHLAGHLNTTYDAGVSFIAVGNDVYANGGIEFRNVELIDACDAAPDPLLLFRDVSSEGVGYNKIAGQIASIKLNEDGSIASRQLISLDGKQILELFPQLGARKVEPFDLKSLNSAGNSRLSSELALAWSTDVMTKGGFRARGGGEYYFYAKAGTKLWWNLLQRKIEDYPTESVEQVLTTPSGNIVNFEPMPGDCIARTFRYEAPEDGWYFLDARFGASTVELTSEYPIMTAARPNLNVYQTEGTFKFYVPKGSKDLALRVIASPSKHIDATIVDPDGVQMGAFKDVYSLAVWSTPLNEKTGEPIAPKPGFWTVSFLKSADSPLGDYVVTIQGVPALLR